MEKVQIKKYNVDGSTEVIDLSDKIEQVKITKHQNEQLDTAEIVYLSKERNIPQMFDRLNLNEDYFNWYISSAKSVLLDKRNKIYQHVIIATELTTKLSKHTVSNLSFNKELDGSPTYPTLLSVVERIIKLTPIEVVARVENTRIVDGLTPRAQEALAAITNVKEFQFSFRNMLEVFQEIFSLIKAAPRLIANEQGDNILDITFFKDETITPTNINDFHFYEESQDTSYYATSAEIVSNNVIDEDDNLIEERIGMGARSTNFVLDTNLACVQLNEKIYRIIKVEMKHINDANWKDITNHVKEDREFALLDTGRGSLNDPTVQNCFKYKQGDDKITGLGDSVNGNIVWTTTSVFRHVATDYGMTIDSNVGSYMFRVSYSPQTSLRTIVPQTFLGDQNKETSIRINNQERINDFGNLVDLSKNKLERLGAKQTIKKQQYLTYQDVPKVGAYDEESGKYISTIETLSTKGIIDATFILVNELNVVSEYVGVDSVNRFTDIEIGKAIVRDETINEYLVVEDGDFTIEELTTKYKPQECALTQRGLESLFSPSTRIISNYWKVASPAQPAVGLVKGIMFNHKGVLSFKLPINHQTFLGNSLAEGIGIAKKIERGFRYTDSDGFVKRLGLSFGGVVIERNTQTAIDTFPSANAFVNDVLSPLQNEIFTFGESMFVKNYTTTPMPAFTKPKNFESTLDLTTLEPNGVFAHKLKNKITFTIQPLVTPPSNTFVFGYKYVIKGIDEFNNPIVLFTSPTITKLVTLILGEANITLDLDTVVDTNLKSITLEIVPPKEFDVIAINSSTLALEYLQSGTVDETNLIELDKNPNEIINFTYSINSVGLNGIEVGANLVRIGTDRLATIVVLVDGVRYDGVTVEYTSFNNIIGLRLGDASSKPDPTPEQTITYTTSGSLARQQDIILSYKGGFREFIWLVPTKDHPGIIKKY